MPESPRFQDEEPINLAGLTVVGGNEEPQALSERYDAEGLADLLVSLWIPFLECSECGRHDYCKFTKPHPYPRPRSAGRLAEIQCGVVETALRNFVRGAFPMLRAMDRLELQAFLDGAYYLTKFIYDVEQQIGMMINESFMTWLGEDRYRAMFFGSTARLRKYLDQFAGRLRTIDVFQTKTTVILTEGLSEKVFLEGVGRTGLVGLMGLDVQSYHGEGNRGPTRLKLLADRLHGQGYQLFIQGDMDGRARDIFEQLVSQGVVDTENTFAFEMDFESAFPPAMLFDALRQMDDLRDAEYDNFEAALFGRGPGESVLDVIRRQWNVNVDKVELAEALADIFVQGFLFLGHEARSAFGASEIGRFLDKISRMP